MTLVTHDPFRGRKVKGQGYKVRSQNGCSFTVRPTGGDALNKLTSISVKMSKNH